MISSECLSCRRGFKSWPVRRIGQSDTCAGCYAKTQKPYRLHTLVEYASERGCWSLERVDPLNPGKRLRLHCVAHWELYFPKVDPKKALEYRPLQSFTHFADLPTNATWLYRSDKQLPFKLGSVERGLYHCCGNCTDIIFERRGRIYVFGSGGS
jgi:hypothetical protein